MSSDVLAFRAITAALGFFLIGKLLFDYFSRSHQVRDHPDPRVRRLNRLRVYSVIVAFASLGVALPALRAGMPFIGFLIICGIALGAMVICLVCTARVILITGRL